MILKVGTINKGWTMFDDIYKLDYGYSKCGFTIIDSDGVIKFRGADGSFVNAAVSEDFTGQQVRLPSPIAKVEPKVEPIVQEQANARLISHEKGKRVNVAWASFRNPAFGDKYPKFVVFDTGYLLNSQGKTIESIY